MAAPVESLNVARRRRDPHLRGAASAGTPMSNGLFDDDDRPDRSSRSDASDCRSARRERRSPNGCVRARSTRSSARTTSSRPGKPLREAIERDLLQSIILWGPPGTGKTTLARIIAEMTQAHFVPFSAVLAGIKEIKR